jgi:hypothetical protein
MAFQGDYQGFEPVLRRRQELWHKKQKQQEQLST